MRRVGTLLLVCWAGLAARAAESPSGATIDAARSTMDKWVETRQLISKERRDWEQARELLNSRIHLLEGEVTALEEKLAQARSGHSAADQQHSTVVEERRAVVETASHMAAQMAELEGQVRGLHARLPDSMKERLQPLVDRMPTDRQVAKVTVAERFQNVLGLLTEMTKLNSEITVAAEVRALEDGRPSEVHTVYIGLGQAYFVSQRGEAGIGQPGADRWTWKTANDLSQDITLVLDILQNKRSPAFVGLPVTLQ